MADTAATSYTLSQEAIFRGRVQILMAKAAIAVAGESLGSLKHPQWLKRAELARSVLQTPLSWIDQFSFAVCQNAAITSSSSDSDIEFTINSVWDDVAGVTGNDLE